MQRLEDAKFPDDYYVIDVGMHDGKDSEYYLRRGFKVIAFEANPELCKNAVKYFANKGYDDRIDIRNLAISHKPGEALSFFVNRHNSTWSSLDEKLGKRRDGAEEITVTTCDLGEELSQVFHLIHMVKIDIEGFDAVALQQLLSHPNPPKYVSVENGTLQMITLLANAGYDGFKFSNQREVPYQPKPKDQKHGYIVDTSFAKGASGHFGEDIIGGWRNKNEAVILCNALSAAREVASGNLFAEAIGWFDMHARRSHA